MSTSEQDQDHVPQSVASPSETGASERGIMHRDQTTEAIIAWLILQISERLGVEPESIDIRKPLESYGLSSREAVTLSGDLEDWLGQQVSPTLVYNYPTIEALARYLGGEIDVTGPPLVEVEQGTGLEAIAIVGMGCRFPGASSPEAFWQLLRDGLDAIGEVPASRWDLRTFYSPDPESPGKMNTRWGGFLDQVDQWDALFWGISPREAEYMDPQQRLLLEVAWEALENAGQPPERLAGTQTGVFIGISGSDYGQSMFANLNLIDAHASVGNALSVAANRLSYQFDFRGPSIAIDTACSSSLVAIHLACSSLQSGESNLALAGGVNLILAPAITIAFTKAGLMAPGGRCRTFDANAEGYVRGEGCGLVVLKRLSEALAAGDNILAIIRGSAVNHDGRSNGITAPNGLAQETVIRQALLKAKLVPAQISYVEAHGTGTIVGDSIEMLALRKVLLERRSADCPCAFGSVKTNIGHLEAAAGIAGLIKTVLALQHNEIPPHLHLRQLNEHISLANTPFSVPTQRQKWPAAKGHYAGTSSFGFGGANAHVVLEEAGIQQSSGPSRPWQLLLLSAKTESALNKATENLVKHLQAHPEENLADVAYTLQVGRSALEQRRMLACRNVADATAALEARDPVRIVGRAAPRERAGVAFMFPGVGDHYINMGREFYQLEPVFQESVNHCCDLLRPILGMDLLDVLYPAGVSTAAPSQGMDLQRLLGRTSPPRSPLAERLNQTEIAQPAVFVVEYALAQLLQAWGIRPDALIGYSLGEYVAACVAGTLSLQDALTLVARRAQMIQRLPAGSMLTVALSEAEAQPFLDEQVCLAVVNGPTTCVLSGPPEALARVEQRLVASAIACRRLETSHAIHSTMMEPIVAEFTALVQSIPLNEPRIPWLSNVTGGWITSNEATDPAYWARHLCQTVRFGDGLAALLANRRRVLVEVGPGQALSSFAKQHPGCTRDQLPQILSTMRYAYDEQSEVAFLLGALGRLWLAGCQIDWKVFYNDERRQRIPLPTYPFERQRYWIDQPASQAALPPQPSTGKKANVADWFYEPVWKASALPETKGEADRAWLIFEDSLGWGEAIGQQLSQQGAAMVRVKAGKAFEQLAKGVFALRPDAPADYGALLDTLQAAGNIPAQIVHAWGINMDCLAGIEAFGAAQRVGFYSLLYLAQALGERNTAQAIKVVVLTNDMQPVKGSSGCPEKATVLGLCRAVPQEYQNIRCRSVDVSLDEGKPKEELVSQLVAELTASTTEVTVAYRSGARYVQRFAPRPLTAEPTMMERLRARGVYLITGGGGSIGTALAEYLAQRLQARLVLVGRSPLPPRDMWDDWLDGHDSQDPTRRKIERVRAIEALGAQVLVVSADVSNEEQMRACIAQTYEQFGRLDGVIHAAGFVSREAFSSLVNTNRAMCEAHFMPKAYGLYVLDQVLCGVDLDFCLLFSSLTSILGGLGEAAYASANNFMDAYAHKHNRAGSPNWISVNWDFWKTSQAGLPAGSTVAEFAITPEEGVQAFAMAVADGATQLVISTGDLETRIRQWVMLQTLQEEEATTRHGYARPDLGTAYVPARNEYERQIAAIWQEVLGIEQIGVHDNFFDLGGNSLIGMQLVSRIQKAFNVRIPAVALFEAPTVNTLAKYLLPDVKSEPDTEAATLTERRRAARQHTSNQSIAIIGMTGRFPGAKNVGQFWENICNGVESITFFADEALLASGVDPQLIQDPNYVKARPIIDDVDMFDAAFFGYSPREAEILDPQLRLFLECAWEVLELAGYAPDSYKGLIGVFAGTDISTYLLSWITDLQLVQSVGRFQAALSSDKDSLTTMVSYKMNLKGPSIAVQTYCSTSLVATHLACQSLLNGECDMALAGGVCIRVPQKQGYIYQPEGLESPDGHCRTFDARAQGTIFGDGVGVVVLKRLEDALADGDTIYAVVKGSAVNNDGSLKVGYTAPSVAGQAAAISMALERAGVNAETIGYVEAHGTATELGDPIEITSLTQAFRLYTDRKGYCPIGSVKTNVGHLDRAAGMAGLIKTALIVKHGLIPPSLHFEQPNPQIDFENSPFYVNTKLSEWVPQNGLIRRAGVNGLGLGGTNAYVLVEEPPEQTPTGSSRPWQLMLLSARSTEALEAATANLVHYLQQNPDTALADVSYTLHVGRRAFEQRRMLVCHTVADATAALETLDPLHVVDGAAPREEEGVAFMFSGFGDQYVNMGRELYQLEPVFQETVNHCCGLLRPILGLDLLNVLYPADEGAAALSQSTDLQRLSGPHSPAVEQFNQNEIGQPALFVVEYALAQLLQAWGITPNALIGYSLGEYVAACIAGTLSLQDALMLVARRAQMFQRLPAGNMLAVTLSEAEAQPFLDEQVCLAVVNGPTTCVLGGPPEALAQVEQRLTATGIAYRRLETSHAFHTSMMEPIVAEFTTLVESVPLNAPRIPWLSNVTGDWITSDEATDPAYWARHLRQTARFGDGLSVLLSDRRRVLVEVGPGQTLRSLAKRRVRANRKEKAHAAETGQPSSSSQPPASAKEHMPLILPTMRYVYDEQSDLRFLLETLGKLWLHGLNPNWAGFYQAERRHRIPLPTYPFERQRYWVESSQGQLGMQVAAAQIGVSIEGNITLPRLEMSNWFYVPSWKQSAPRLSQLLGRASEIGTCWLILADQRGLAGQVASWLTEHGQKIVIVERGATFQELEPHRYEVRPQSRADYTALLQALRQRGLEPSRIVHMWTVGVEKASPGDAGYLKECLDLGLYSLIYLVQAISDERMACEISVVTSGQQSITSGEQPSPEKALLLGPCRVIPLEYASVTCRCIDVDLPAPDSGQAKALLANLMGELVSEVDDSLVVLRGYQRWVEAFEPLQVPAVSEGGLQLLRPGGVYMVTGGLGGLGLALADHLARLTQARLVLVSRSGLPPRGEWERLALAEDSEEGVKRKIRAIQALEAAGSEVEVLAADVADEAQILGVVQRAVARFGGLHGVIHAAGAPGKGLIQLKTPEMAAEVLLPKVTGTLALERALQGIELDWLVLFSSIASVAGGGPGQADYCAANSFLDAYAQSQVGNKRLTISINWCDWQWNAWAKWQAGFGQQIEMLLKERRERFGITFEEGGQVLMRALSCHLPRIVISTQNLGQVLQFTREATLASILDQEYKLCQARAKHSRSELTTPYAAPTSKTEERIIEIWEALLGFEPIGVHDNFFELGGHSLLATQVASRVRQVFQIELPLRTILEKPTIASLAMSIEAIVQAGQEESVLPLASVRRADKLPLSYAQQRLWFLDQLEPGSASYNEPTPARIMGCLDVEALEWSLKQVIQRHEVLRTTFGMMDGQAAQMIAPTLVFSMPVVSLEELLQRERANEVERLAQEDAQRPFDLERGPLLRASLLRLDAEEHVLLMNMHHIVTDGWSMGILTREVAEFYRAYVSGQAAELPELPIQYADFAVWQREWLQGERLEAHLAYWKRQLSGAPPHLELPTDHPRPAAQTFRGARQSFSLPRELSNALQALSQREGVTLFMALLAAFQTLLRRYTGQRDIVVGSPIANRNQVEIENLIGFFVNTLMLRADLRGNPTFSELLRQVREVTLGAYAHQDMPFEQLVDALQPARDLSRSPLFQVVFVFQNVPAPSLQLSEGASLRPVEFESQIAKFDLTLFMNDTPEGLRGTLEYNTDLFEHATMARLVEHLHNLLEGVVANPDQKLADLPLLTEAERQQLLVEWNATKTDYPCDKCVHELFEEQVEQRPEAIALVYKDHHLSYRELNQQANRLAHYLTKSGVGPEVLVGICLERSVEMVVGLLGILKAGGAYVPLDPSYPTERLRMMLDDTQVQVVLTKAKLAERLPEHEARIVHMDSSIEGAKENLNNRGEAVNLAYVMYTSGSTGRPKGVSVTHRGITRLVKGTNYAALSEKEIMLHFAPISFDASTFEIWGSLLNGGRLVVYPTGVASLEELGELVRAEEVSTLWLTAGLFHQIVNEQMQNLKSVRQLLAGGDVLSGGHVQKVKRAHPGCWVVNGYGPTENTTFSACYQVPENGWGAGSVPIGRPIANTQVYILDEQMRPVPIGVAGKVYVGGDGLARDYWRRAELTAAAFVPHPYSRNAGERLYQTGDVGRYLPDGNIEFLGREDGQVKIRGYRVELGEIEAVLRQHEGVREAVVMAHKEESGEKHLVGYLVPNDGNELPAGALRRYVMDKLPEYMVPTAFVVLETLPLTANGKVDRQALPAPGAGRPELERAFVAPRTPLEETLASIWSQVLGVEQVGVHDNFFELGGHSLLATRLASKLREALEIELPLRHLFETPTVAGLAQSIETIRWTAQGMHAQNTASEDNREVGEL